MKTKQKVETKVPGVPVKKTTKVKEKVVQAPIIKSSKKEVIPVQNIFNTLKIEKLHILKFVHYLEEDTFYLATDNGNFYFKNKQIYLTSPRNKEAKQLEGENYVKALKLLELAIKNIKNIELKNFISKNIK